MLQSVAPERLFTAHCAEFARAIVDKHPFTAHCAESVERNQISYLDSTGAVATASNKVVTVWRKQADGSWKNVIDMWNADPGAWDR